MSQKYSGYHAFIYEGDDAPSAAAIGEKMKQKFHGADYELIEGDPWGQCDHVEGEDEAISASIAKWISDTR
jgi:hypothetical protein